MHSYASVALVDRRGWLLMQERDEHPLIDPECWGFPGGGIEDGESPREAAARELLEETGLRLQQGLTSVGVWELEHPVAGRQRCHLYGAAVDLDDDDVVCGEGRQMVFVDPATLRGLPLTLSCRLALPQLLSGDLYAGAVR